MEVRRWVGGWSAVWRNSVYNILARGAVMLINALVTLVVARWIGPAEMGVFAVAASVNAVLVLLRDGGFRDAVIASERSIEELLPLQMGLQLCVGLLLYGIVWGVSPWLAHWLNMPEVKWIVRILALTTLVAALEDTLTTYMLKLNRYKELVGRQLIPSLAFGAVAIGGAASGWGVWSLVTGYLTRSAVAILYLLGIVRKIPFPSFRVREWVAFLRMGWHILLQRFAGYLVSQFDSLLVGKALGATLTGIYRVGAAVGKDLLLAPVTYSAEVFFTSGASQKHSSRSLHLLYHRYVRFWFLFTLVALVGLLIGAKLVEYFLGSRWSGVAFTISIFGACALFTPFVRLNGEFAKLVGTYRYFSVFSIVIALVTVLGIGFFASHGLEALMAFWTAMTFISVVANSMIFFATQKQIRVTVSYITVFGVASVIVALVVCGMFLLEKRVL